MSEKYDIIIRNVGQNLIKEYEENGIVKCGINGPYDDPETRVRNLSHLIIITAIEIISFGKEHYIDVLNNMGAELLSLRESSGLYIMREKEGKDLCNGVIGHAWVIEALIYLYKVTKDTKYVSVADEIASFHVFEYNIGLWSRPQVKADDNGIDYTLNHQLWYAASLCELNEVKMDAKYQKEILRFLDCLKTNMHLSTKGKVAHNIYSRLGFKARVKNYIKEKVNYLAEMLGCSSMSYKEEGYHLFNIMALSRIIRLFPEHNFFKSKKFNRSVMYCNTDEFKKGLMNSNYKLDKSLHNCITNETERDINIYGYPYNVPGFEMPYCAFVLNHKIDPSVCNQIIKMQFDLTYDIELKCFKKKCHDSNTVNYRVYEYYRFLEMEH